MVNTVKKFFETDVADDELAIVFFDGIKSFSDKRKCVTFGELKKLSIQYQAYLKSLDLAPEDSILLFEEPSPNLYALLIAILASGHQVLLIEPWMPLKNISHIIKKTAPKVFVCQFVGKLWGLRSKEIRRIKHWTSTNKINKFKSNQTSIEITDVHPDHHALLTFTSGTSGRPKGVYRKHQFLDDVSDTIGKYLEYDKFRGRDLTIFPNLVLGNLGLGKGSIVIPSRWPKNILKQLDLIPPKYAPDTLACGPAFLAKVMKYSRLDTLRAIHIGGALTDCDLLEEAFEKCPQVHFSIVYGSSEAEPVSIANAKEAVKQSREKSFHQCLYLGKPIEEISTWYRDESLWISGKHVSPLYIDDNNANEKNKFVDEHGKLWHNMGDRIEEENDVLWYMGRDFQSREDFLLEQKIYSYLKNSNGFIHRINNKVVYIFDCDINEKEFKEVFPQVKLLKRAKIKRDKRHRARIDRTKTLQKSGIK
jgi:acyl-coenzyme A synthetase/AMP-(fatty) acid ligase